MTAPAAARSRAHYLVLLAALLGPTVPWILGRALDPDPRGHGTHEQLGLEPCGMVVAFDLPCPGCGITTSLTFAGEGRFLDSIRTQPFGFLLAIFAAIFLPWSLFAHLHGRDLWLELRKLPLAKTCIVLAALVGTAWVYKLATF